jgi:hypothetical protein
MTRILKRLRCQRVFEVALFAARCQRRCLQTESSRDVADLRRLETCERKGCSSIGLSSSRASSCTVHKEQKKKRKVDTGKRLRKSVILLEGSRNGHPSRTRAKNVSSRTWPHASVVCLFPLHSSVTLNRTYVGEWLLHS